VPIRTWRVEDLPQIDNLLSALSISIGHQYEGNLQLLQQHFSSMAVLRNVYSTFVYTTDDGTIAGVISVVWYESVLHRKGTALVNELVVDEAFRGKGIGGELLNYCIKLAEQQGYDEIEVGVEKTNLEAVRFYKRHGIDQEYVLLGKEFGAGG
jgi:ribosomal protein S18 acetylase RimI-like enzyme